jgi:hypothetical protein
MTEREAGVELAESVQRRGNFGFTLAGILGRPRGGRAPLGIATFLAIPLFFSSLMASALAQERPAKPKAICHLTCTFYPPSTGNEARVWLWALVPSLVLVVVGVVAARLPLGFYVSCVAGIVVAMAVVHKTATWAQHHTARFPFGVDLIPPSDPQSNQWDAGQWEAEARSTALSLQHWTIGLALAAMLAMALLWLRGRRAARRAAL